MIVKCNCGKCKYLMISLIYVDLIFQVANTRWKHGHLE